MLRIIRAFFYSCAGIKAAYVDEPAFRQEVWISIIAIPVALWVDVELLERVLLIGSILIVLLAELVNTAIEAVVDYISREKHQLAKKAKDTASAAVLLALINAGLTWFAILMMPV